MHTGNACHSPHPNVVVQAPDFSQEFAARFLPAVQPTVHQPLPAAAAYSIYSSGLDAATAKSLASVSPQIRSCREQLRSEVLSFLAAMPYGHTLQTCTPFDLLVFLEEVYIPNHAGSQLPNGQTIVAPSTMANTVSHLRQIFRQLGRGQQWDLSSSMATLPAPPSSASTAKATEPPAPKQASESGVQCP